MNKALQNESAGRAASVNYIQVVFAMLADAIIFDNKPHILSLVGTFIVGSSIIVMAVAKVRAMGK